MAIKTIFTNDIQTSSLDELEIFADNEGYITIQMNEPSNDMCFCKIQIDKEHALLLLELLTKEIDLI